MGRFFFTNDSSNNVQIMARMRLINPVPVGPDNSLLYEQLILSSYTADSPISISYRQGSLIEGRFGLLEDPTIKSSYAGDILGDIAEIYSRLTTAVIGSELRRRIDGEPIDEFRRMRDILDQVNSE